jgi:hypothetical protein
MREGKGLAWPQVRVFVVAKGGGAPSASRTLFVQSFYRLNCSWPFNPFTVTYFKPWPALQTISYLYIRFVYFSFYSVNFAAQFMPFQLQNFELLETSVVIVWMKENWNKMVKKNCDTFEVGWADTLVHASAFWIGSESERVGTVWLQFTDGTHMFSHIICCENSINRVNFQVKYARSEEIFIGLPKICLKTVEYSFLLLCDSLSSLNLHLFTFRVPSQVTVYIPTLRYNYSVCSYVVIWTAIERHRDMSLKTKMSFCMLQSNCDRYTHCTMLGYLCNRCNVCIMALRFISVT